MERFDPALVRDMTGEYSGIKLQPRAADLLAAYHRALCAELLDRATDEAMRGGSGDVRAEHVKGAALQFLVEHA